MKNFDLRIPPLAVALLFSVLMACASVFGPVLDVVWLRLMAALFFLTAGSAVALAGVVAFRRHRTTVNPFTPEKSTTLVDSGVYRISRNPMYLGFFLVLAGWAAMLGSLWAALWLPAFVVYMNRFQIEPEERALTERFGKDFLIYSEAVRRWL